MTFEKNLRNPPAPCMLNKPSRIDRDIGGVLISASRCEFISNARSGYIEMARDKNMSGIRGCEVLYKIWTNLLKNEKINNFIIG